MTIDYFENLAATVSSAIEEDIRGRDVTAALIDTDASMNVEVITREEAVIAGRPWVDEVFSQIDPAISVQWKVSEGALVEASATLFTASGPARSLLTAERTALNFLQTLSGTATRTQHYVELVRHTGVRLLDTRKTLPGLRLAQKYAVRTGGGHNHRIGLFDAFLIKENHIMATGSITRAIEEARRMEPDIRVEVEVENMAEFREAVAAGPDWIMLDNFSHEDILSAVRSDHGAIRLEVSGGIESETDLIRIAETGVDYISLGALTKHCRAIDLSMRAVSR